MKEGWGLLDENQQKNVQKNAREQNQIFFTKLNAFGGIVSTIGGAISTVATLLALQDLLNLKGEIDIEGENLNNDGRIKELENQVQYLIKEIDTLKRTKR